MVYLVFKNILMERMFMANLMINLPDDLKLKWQKQCSVRGLSMTELVVSWIKRDTLEYFGPESSAIPVGASGVPQCECLLCGFKWTPKKVNPIACPACKSYRWNDTALAEKRVATAEKRERRAVESAIKEQKNLFNEFWREYERIQQLTEYKSGSEVAAKLGTTSEKLTPYLKGEAPVTAEQVSRMKEIV